MKNRIIQKFKGFEIIHEDDLVSFVFNDDLFNRLEKYDFEIDTKCSLIYQFITDNPYLSNKSKIHNGYSIQIKDFMSILDDFQEVVELPINPLKGFIILKPRGLNAHTKNYNIFVQFQSTRYPSHKMFKTAGYVLEYDNSIYNLNRDQEIAFRTLRNYELDTNKSPQVHYNLVSSFKKIKSETLIVDTAHFDSFILTGVNKVGLRVNKLSSGDIQLEPNLLGVKSLNEKAINRELNFVQDGMNSTTLYVGNELISLNQNAINGVRHIQKKAIIPKEESRLFLENPGSYFTDGLIDLSSFSCRVAGIKEFIRINLVDLDKEFNDWFLSNAPLENEDELVENFESLIHSIDELESFEKVAIESLKSNCKKVWFKSREVKLPAEDEFDTRLADKRAKLLRTNKPNVNEDVGGQKISKVTFEINFSKRNESIRNLFEEHELPEKTFEDLEYKPLNHQEDAVKWLYSLYRCSLTQPDIRGGILADDMGLGKTFSGLLGMKSIIEYRRQVGKQLDKCFMIVAPLTLLKNWKEELTKFFKVSPFRDVVILNQQSDLQKFKCKKEDEVFQEFIPGQKIKIQEMERVLRLRRDSFGDKSIDQPGRLIITNYETLSNYQFSMGLIDFHCVIFDEAQRIKNPNTIATRVAKALKSELNIIATGTPVENNLEEYWCLMDTANPELLGTHQQFKESYINPLKKSEDEKLKLEIGRDLYQKSQPFLLRRTKEELKDDLLENLPGKRVFKGLKAEGFEYLKPLDEMMTKEQLMAFDKIRQNQKVSSEKMRSTLANLTRIRACMLHPRITFENNSGPLENIDRDTFWLGSARLKALYEVIRLVKMKDEKLIIFVISRAIQYVMKQWIYREFFINPDIVSGATKTESKKYEKTRLGKIQKFSEKVGFNIIILSPKAAGVGLNIVAANHIFHLERDWNPAKESQANDRAYRIGQKKEVSIYYPISKHPSEDSFDVKLDRLLNRKIFTKDVLMTYPKNIEHQLGNEIF